ncbi:hypothetical protein [Sanguibacter antarcticus]|uniref:hypothetical protein n=1 Tax=Sanguibacter antarcticus TaxID=372484 RepID=UPI000BF958E7|nr:hypothetical protein [Sanguibacter antarcticus]
MSTAPCSGPQVADASQLRGATYLINDSPIALSEVWASIDECPVALPLATFVEATGNEDDSVLTLWGPDAKAGVASVEAFEGAYTTVLPGSRTDAWVVEFPWGAWVQWSDDTGDYILTASGIEADTATAAAAAYSETRSQESIHAILPDLQLVPAAELPARNTRWTAVYGNSDPRPGDDTPWLSLEVTAGELPATALASLQPIPATGLTLREPTTSDVHTGDNGGFRYARWTTATGAHVQLIGNLTIDELRGLAMQVQAVLPADPRIDGKQILSPPATVQTL